MLLPQEPSKPTTTAKLGTCPTSPEARRQADQHCDPDPRADAGGRAPRARPAPTEPEMRTKKRAQDGLPARAHALSPPERKAPGSETKTSERELRVRRLESGRAHPAGPPGDRGLFTPSRAGRACRACGPGRGRRQRRGGRRRRRAARPPPGDPGPGVPGGLRRALSLTRAAGGGTAQGRAEDQAGEQKPQQPQVPRGGRRDGRRHPSAPPPGQHGTVRPGARLRLRAPRWRRRRRRRRSRRRGEKRRRRRR